MPAMEDAHAEEEVQAKPIGRDADGSPTTSLSFDASATTSASLELNGVSCLRAVIVHAAASPLDRLTGASLQIEIDGFADCAFRRALEPIDAGASLAVDASGFLIPLALLRGMTERRHVDIVATLSDTEGLALIRESHRLAIVPESHWCGVSNTCESLAAFVTPNAPAIAGILRDASARLAARTGSGALDGYLSGSAARAQRIAEACFEALASQAITYNVLQASFESDGQKIRSATEVLSDRLGNCLDLSVTLAALFEACGLLPMILLGDGHATVAFATIDSHFADAVHDGPSRLENRRALGEIRVIEATAACAARAGFGEALTVGERWLAQASDRIRVVDIRASRRAGFHPLPEILARNHQEDITQVQPPSTEWGVVQPSGLPPLPKPKLTPQQARLETWKKKLLDLTLRNRLLNDRDASGVPLMAEGDAVLAHLEDALSSERAMTLKSRGAMREMAQPAMTDEIAGAILRARLDDAELFTRATKAYRDAKSSLDETGARSLYIAIGFLEYTVEQRKDSLRAPLILVPVTLERISRAEGFRVRPVADDTVPNVALVEYLRLTHGLDIGLSGAITEDDKGIDVPTLLARVRQSVKDVPGAVVLAKAKLGNYSFKKLPLFEEMRSRGAALIDHPVVRSLLDRSAVPTLRNARLLEPEQVDSAAPFETIRLPLAADSSQIAAVCSAAAGRTFVLQGPPGTGKSQTITNLLAECLARGKRVLFIAEKSAALEVVSERLRKTGLGSFALDLHAENATKTNFVAQIKQSLDELDARAAPLPPNFAKTTSTLDANRNRLKAACDALHGALANGLSAHDAILRTTALAAYEAPALAGALDGVLHARPTHDDIAMRLAATARLATARADLPIDATEFLADFSPNALLTPEESTRIAAMAREASTRSAQLAQRARALRDALGLEPAENSAPTTAGHATDAIGDIARAVEFADSIDTSSSAAAWLADAACAIDHSVQLDAAARVLELGARGHAARSAIEDRFARGVLDLPLASIAGDLRAARERFILFRWLATRKSRALLIRFAKSTLTSEFDGLLAEVESLVAHAAAITAADAVAKELARFTSADGTIDFEAMRAAIVRARQTARTIRTLYPSVIPAIALRIPRSIADGSLAASRDFARESLAKAREVFAQLDTTAGATPPLSDDSTVLVVATERLARLATHAVAMSAWSAFTAARADATTLGLRPVAELLLTNTISDASAERAVERELLASWVRARLRTEPPLADCAADRMAVLRSTFATSIDEYRKGAAKVVAAAVRARAIAALASANEDDAMRRALGRVNELRALTTIRRPIRRVMVEGAPAIAAIKPIVLASPLSASTMLPPEFPQFDLVVFDEASQVPVWDAACAISRGVCAVIVGDSKQLPPTNFFDRRDSGEANDSEADLADALEPLESVLEEAIASGIPQRSLLWHYRSRDERLIEFSNRRSYGGRLQTFPAAQRAHPNLGVEFRFVGGIYDRAATSTNRAEAEAIVTEIARRLLDDDDCAANRSIGVVTFSVAQQTLVQDLLDEALERDGKLRERAADAAKLGDEVFVKNLENVQGDERATMLFSICYGRDASGAMYHNFGPLNLSGGERRLNVAVTRAKEKIVLFSSIRAGDLDPKKCNAKGAQDLRDYLAFAELGTVPATRGEGPPAADLDVSSIERALACALEARGWRVDLHVGRSRDYRVSLALTRPETPEKWLLGVELDGIFHRTAPTVVDRTIVRGGVLESLGWTTLQVSAVDVLRDIAKVVDRIDAAARARA